MPVFQVGFEVIALCPFVPRVNKNQALAARLSIRGVHQLRETLFKAFGRCIKHNNAVPPPAWCSVPTDKNARNRRKILSLTHHPFSPIVHPLSRLRVVIQFQCGTAHAELAVAHQFANAGAVVPRLRQHAELGFEVQRSVEPKRAAIDKRAMRVNANQVRFGNTAPHTLIAPKIGCPSRIREIVRPIDQKQWAPLYAQLASIGKGAH